jgi:hypothetical protein
MPTPDPSLSDLPIILLCVFLCMGGVPFAVLGFSSLFAVICFVIWIICLVATIIVVGNLLSAK